MRSLFPVVVGVVGLVVAAGVFSTSGCKSDGKRKIELMTPKSGTYRGGDPITVHGSGFSSGAGRQVKVHFLFPKLAGDTEARREEATVQRTEGDDKLIITSPPGRIGDTVDAMFVFADGKELVYPKAFKYTDPSAGYGLDEMVTGKDKKKKEQK